METVTIERQSSGRHKIDEVGKTAERPAREQMLGSQIFINALEQEGVEVLFGYPGGVVLGLYDEIYKSSASFKHILVRHEQGGTHAADGYARASGKPGVMLATSGPGATNTVTGIATAYMDSIPLVVFTGQVHSALIGNDAFQEADIVGITRPITKHSFLVKDVAELERVVHQAFHIARTGRPGPVLVDLPKDILNSSGTFRSMGPIEEQRNPAGLTADIMAKIDEAAELLNDAKSPLIYAGGGVILGNASDQLTQLAKQTGMPVTTTLMGLGGFPESSPLALGMLGMHGTWYANMAISECDVLLAVGARFDDRVTGRLDGFSQNSKKIHIDIDASCINKNVEVDVPIVGYAKEILPELVRRIEKPEMTAWWERIEQWKREHPLRHRQMGDMIMPQFLMQKISEVTEGNAIVVTDVGQHQMWMAQYYKFNKPRSWITSGGLGTMGYGFPAAMGAAMACPDRDVVCITGDGGFQMTIFELATAVEYKVPVKIALMNNGYLGMVRQWQEMFFGKRYSYSDLRTGNPDFVKLAESYGAAGMRATKPDEVVPVLEAGMKVKDKPVVMEFVVAEEANVFPMVPAGAALTEMVDTDD